MDFEIHFAVLFKILYRSTILRTLNTKNEIKISLSFRTTKEMKKNVKKRIHKF